MTPAPRTRTMSPDERAVGSGAAALAAALFGSAYVATAIQLRDVSPLGGALWRAVIALGILVVVAAARRTRSPAPSGARPWTASRLAILLVIGILGGPIFIVGMNEAISQVGATVTAFVAGLYAVLAALFAPFVLKERLEARAVVGFVLALAGAVLLAELNLSGPAIAGLAFGMLAAVSYGLYLVLIRRWSREIDVGPVGISIATAGSSAAGLAVLLAVTGPGPLPPGLSGSSALVSTAWLGVVTAFGPLLAAAALRRIEASLASSMLLLNPISATILAVILLGDWPTPVQVLGGAMVLVGIAMATGVAGVVRRRRDPASGTGSLAESRELP